MFQGVSSELLSVIFLAALILLYRRQQVFITLLKFPLRLAEPERVERSAMPAYTARLLDGARQELEAAGFRYVYTQAAAPMNMLDPRPLEFSDCYWHPEHSTLAVARVGEAYTGQAASINFLTVFADGKKLLTVNRIEWALYPALEEHIRQDAYAADFHGQWQFHRSAHAREVAHRSVITNMDEAIALTGGTMARTFAQLQAMGWIHEASPGVFRFTAKGAWHYARLQLRGAKQARAALRQPYRHAQAPDLEALRAAEMNSFATTIELAAQPMPQWMKAALFALTLAASVLLFGRMISFAGAIALLLVLLVHEMGHLIAMWAFGFRNLSILFLPFLGAVATGHKEHVKPWQEVIILLAGPVPGLIAALFLSQVNVAGLPPATADFVRTTFWFALLLNLFNLLPVSVLDGGKLFQLAVLSRFPLVRAVFAAIGSFIGLIYCLMTGHFVMAMALILMLMGTGHQFRGAHAISDVRARARALGLGEGVNSLGKEQVVALLGQHLAQPKYAEASVRGWAWRTAIARIAYPRLLQGVPGLGSSLGALAAHGLAFFAPLFVAAWIVQQPGQAPILRQVAAKQDAAGQENLEQSREKQRQMREKFMARYEAASDPEEKWGMIEDEGEGLGLDRQWLAGQRAALLPRLPEDHPAKLRPLLEQAKVGGPEADQIIFSVIAQLTRGSAERIAALDDTRYIALNNALLQLSWQAGPQTLAEPQGFAAQDAMLEAAWQRLERLGADRRWREEQGWRQPLLASSAAHLAFAAGYLSRAEAWMARKATRDAEPDYDELEQAWFRLDLGRADQVLAQATRRAVAPGVGAQIRRRWLALAGWAEMARGNANAADTYFVDALNDRARGQEEDSRDYDVMSALLAVIQGHARHEAPVDGAMLDHLAALSDYAPRQAARYREQLADGMTPAWRHDQAHFIVQNWAIGGWGMQRRAVLTRVLQDGGSQTLR